MENGYLNYLIGSGYLGYLLWMLPCFLLSLFAQIKVKSSFNKYSQINNSRHLTGAQAAYELLSSQGIKNVQIVPTSGSLTDHFDPRTNTIALSESVYNSTSIAAVGVACHEAGHACQHAQGYVPNKIRTAIVPACNIGSRIAWILIILGFIPFSFSNVLLIAGIILYSLSVIFTIVTLPVEFNASKRALKIIKENHMLTEEEYPGAKSVLTSAAMTYVAAACVAIAQLLRLILIASRRN